ncbi:MAG: isoprenylcysteine carboxylmethyltransferase family protein [Vulcanimicrobiota bacterium]
MRLKNRIPPPLVFLVTGLAMFSCAPRIAPLPGAVVLIPLLVLVALLHAVPAFFQFRGAATTVSPLRPAEASSLVTSGPYRWTRNPMYLGLTCLLLAWAAYLGSLRVFLGPLFFVAYITYFQILPEEQALRQLFGQEYEQYRLRVPRWL